MAKSATVSDPYLENITAQIQEIDEQIKAANKKLFDRKAELETIKTHYIKFKKSMLEGK